MLPRNLSPEKLSSRPAGTILALRNPFVSNILRVNPSFAIFYPDSARPRAANSSLLKDLEVQSVFFFNPDQPSQRKKRSTLDAPNRSKKMLRERDPSARVRTESQ
jgi:hypothetical protein